MMDALFVDSDSDTYTETSDSEDQEYRESLFGEHAQSILSCLDESIEKIDNFLAFDRGFALGEIVSSVVDPSGELGRILDVHLLVDLETNSGELLRDINSKNLLRVRSFASEDFVIYGPWLGQIEKVYDSVTIILKDGTKREILIGDSKVLTPLPPCSQDSTFPFYPGQHVKVNIPTISRSKSWLYGSQKANQNEGTICNVEVGLVYVNWIASFVGQGINLSAPPHLHDPKNLTLLTCFSHANWQLGDFCTLPEGYLNNLQMGSERSGSVTSQMHLTKMQKESDNQNIYVIGKIKSKVDVLWQNGEKSVGLNPQSLSPVSDIGDHDFWPEQYVLEKVDMHVPRPQKLGIVKNVNSRERTVEVKWILSEPNHNVDVSGASTNELMSAYELIEHTDFSYSIGDIVLRHITHLNHIEENTLDVQNNGQKERNKFSVDIDRLPFEVEILKKPIVECQNSDVRRYLSCIGNVIGYKDEGLEVKWASGEISKVTPYEIFGLDRLLHPASTPSNSTESFAADDNKEITDQEKQMWSTKRKNVANDTDGNCMKDVWKAASFLFPGAAFGFLTHVATGLFNSFGSIYLSDAKATSLYKNLKTGEFEPETTELRLGIMKQHLEGIKQSEEPILSPDNDEPRNFKQFDIVNDCSDHHFMVGKGNELVLSQVSYNKSWFKKVQQDWSILKTDLPDSIYVRVYEERMDILRASIIGAPGTPYHDALFFFDIFLPSDYPYEPPVVHYISGGLRLNPNLYESGKVCLSLLKTWIGTGSEVWHPEKSTILQVLLSLQALVLNDKPYFNEAGYDEQIGRIEGEKNSITYNENAFLQSCKSMLYILRKPPKHFEALVQEHSTRRSHHILIACKAYLEGAQIGRAYECGEEMSEHRRSSTGFRIMLAKLFPKLVSAFLEREIDCNQFLEYSNKFSNAGREADA